MPWDSEAFRQRLLNDLNCCTSSGLLTGSDAGVLMGTNSSSTWGLASKDAIEWANSYGYDLVKGITGTTAKRLQGHLADAAAEGLTVDDLRRRLEDDPLLFGPVRARLIAQTEMTRAFSEGMLRSWARDPYVVGKEWITAQDEMVCPICGGMSGVVVSADGMFTLPNGNRVSAPPAHVGCRCSMRPKMCCIIPATAVKRLYALGVPKWMVEKAQQCRDDDSYPATNVRRGSFKIPGEGPFDTEPRVSRAMEKAVLASERGEEPLRAKESTIEQYVNVLNTDWDVVERTLTGWSYSSNNHPESLMLQEAAARVFKLNLSDYQIDRIGHVYYHYGEPFDDLDEDDWQAIGYDSVESYADTFVRMLYNDAQEYFRRNGNPETITLYRGMTGEAFPAGVRTGDVIPYSGNALESWTLNPEVAQFFSVGASGGIISAEVPTSRILSIADMGEGRVGLGFSVAEEAVVMNNLEGVDPDKVKVMWHYEPGKKREVKIDAAVDGEWARTNEVLNEIEAEEWREAVRRARAASKSGKKMRMYRLLVKAACVPAKQEWDMPPRIDKMGRGTVPFGDKFDDSLTDWFIDINDGKLKRRDGRGRLEFVDENVDAETKAKLVAYWSGNLAVPPEVAHAMIKGWAVSSNRTTMSRMLQETAADVFHSKLSPYQEEANDIFDYYGDEITDFLKDVDLGGRSDGYANLRDFYEGYTRVDLQPRQTMTSFVKGVYNTTQRILPDNQLRLYRGFRVPEQQWMEWTGQSQSGYDSVPMSLTGNVLESWSFYPPAAQSFATGDALPGEVGLVLACDFPKERIWSTGMTGPGCLDEVEAIVIGGANIVDDAYVTPVVWEGHYGDD